MPNSSCHFLKHKLVFRQTLYQSWVPSNITPLYFLSSNINYFGKKQPIKVQFFEIFECLGQNLSTFLMLLLNWQVSSFSNFVSFFIVITHNSPVNFKLKHFLLWIKGPNKSPNFETFLCSGEILPNSSCDFPNHKSVFLQISHHSLLSWTITPWYFRVFWWKFAKFLMSFSKPQVNFSFYLGQTLDTLHERYQSKDKFFRLLSPLIKIHQILVIFETTNLFFFKFCITLSIYI